MKERGGGKKREREKEGKEREKVIGRERETVKDLKRMHMCVSERNERDIGRFKCWF